MKSGFLITALSTIKEAELKSTNCADIGSKIQLKILPLIPN